VTRDTLRGLAVLVAMLATTGLSSFPAPVERIADSRPAVNLEALVPERFGNWNTDKSIIPIGVSPDVMAALDKSYNQILMRTYVNSAGERIMLSIAYGADQSDNLNLHLPEGCYDAQGFAVGEKITVPMRTPFGEMTVARLLAKKEQRVEPITYWMVIGGEVATSSWEAKKIKLAYAVKRQIPDGILFRISSISRDPERGYALQREFANAMMLELGSEARRVLVGGTLQ
jgi:EpsI family protein